MPTARRIVVGSAANNSTSTEIETIMILLPPFLAEVVAAWFAFALRRSAFLSNFIFI